MGAYMRPISSDPKALIQTQVYNKKKTYITGHQDYQVQEDKHYRNMYLVKAYSPVNNPHSVTSGLFISSNLTEIQ